MDTVPSPAPLAEPPLGAEPIQTAPVPPDEEKTAPDPFPAPSAEPPLAEPPPRDRRLQEH